MTSKDELETLIARVSMGDRAAFEKLYGQTSPKLFAVCLRVLHEPGLAEDVLQSVYCKVWQGAGQYRANGFSPMAWLITLAREAAVDHLKQHGSPAKPAVTDFPDRLSFDSEALAMASSEAQALAYCMKSLPPEHGAMMKAAYLDGVDYSDIARIDGVSPETARGWIRSSLLQLRDCLS
ncbi:sigma-70 family RNA polymerase sigma factor [Thalassococcus lentus]|uniref:Sigma-70 family RNA polymerase sigma factor n=1 Tax=Thalassococcus lentus TaxID=1210524 RepID=A0ABT4XV30_9RHOB|nr:sigma-70 family RNA polymerase sigma factor [Thalassococcus lentus]MDA7425757.1 sigma-70 family RNA polymerase sigma factor [Thalassococcus lentus]